MGSSFLCSICFCFVNLLYLLMGFLFISISPPIMDSANVQVVPAAEPMMVDHILMKILLVMVDMMEAVKLVMALNSLMIALSHSLLEVMAMPDSKSCAEAGEGQRRHCAKGECDRHQSAHPVLDAGCNLP